MANDLQNNISGRCDDVWRTIGKVVARAGLAALIAMPVHGVLAQQGDAVEAGRLQFDDKCVVCHGPEGKGDGVLAPTLNQQPADLTLLTRSYGGTFPNSEVFNKIWGREDEVISTHQMSEMPAFYDAPVFGHDKDFESNAGRLSPAQIKEIIAFLETIQEP
jgi:mono/diheme cytochrome c family protein